MINTQNNSIDIISNDCKQIKNLDTFEINQNKTHDIEITSNIIETTDTVNSHTFIYNNLWQPDEENILKKWADKALCLKLLHDRANKKYWCLNAWFNIPIIIISTITGTANFASSSINNNTNLFISIIGGFNIFGGILATIATYTGIAQKLEAHRFASISWDKFSRKIQVELSKPRKDRVTAKEFVKHANDDYDRLIEISPTIPTDVIRWFRLMIESGETTEYMDECAQCIYDCICFPFGCRLCYCCNCNFFISKNKNNFKPSWENIELPEIIGYIKPTEISHI